MEIVWTKKSNFFRRRAFTDSAEYGEFELGGKKLALYFIEERGIIEVTHQDDATEVFELDEEERIIVIEGILKEYTTFTKSIIHGSVRHYFETYTLVDTSNIKERVPVRDLKKGDKTLLDEYLDSEKAKMSENNLFVTLYEIDKYLANTKFLKDRPQYYEIKRKLNSEQWMDLKYFIGYILYTRLKNDSLKFEISKKISTIKFTFED